MEKFEDSPSVKPASDFMTEMMTDEKDGEEFTKAYLKARFLSSVGRSLYYARRKACLTQTQVAERINTKQSVIARFEADKRGSISFHRYVDFAIACGMMPRSLTLHSILEPINSLRDEVIASAKTQSEHEHLSGRYATYAQAFTVDSVKVHLVSNSALATSLTPLTNQDAKAVIEFADYYVKQSQRQDTDESVTTASSGRQKRNVTQLALLS